MTTTNALIIFFFLYDLTCVCILSVFFGRELHFKRQRAKMKRIFWVLFNLISLVLCQNNDDNNKSEKKCAAFFGRSSFSKEVKDVKTGSDFKSAIKGNTSVSIRMKKPQLMAILLKIMFAKVFLIVSSFVSCTENALLMSLNVVNGTKWLNLGGNLDDFGLVLGIPPATSSDLTLNSAIEILNKV